MGELLHLNMILIVEALPSTDRIDDDVWCLSVIVDSTKPLPLLVVRGSYCCREEENETIGLSKIHAKKRDCEYRANEISNPSESFLFL